VKWRRLWLTILYRGAPLQEWIADGTWTVILNMDVYIGVPERLPMKLRHVGLMLAVGSLAASAGWAEAQPESRERFVCTFGASHRYVDIYRLASRGPRGGGCRVDYTRDGVTKPVWSATGDYAYCVKRAVNLVTKLSKGNFSCRPQTVDQPGMSGSAPPEPTPPEPTSP
jgi:hypothetical protein